MGGFRDGYKESCEIPAEKERILDGADRTDPALTQVSDLLGALPGDSVSAGAEVVKVESRQPGTAAVVVPLTAPLGGLVTHLDVRLGDPVEPDKALLEITDLGEVHAIARVPEHVAGAMKPGVKAHISVAALPGAKLEGTLLRFGTAADAVSGTIDAIFVLPNADGALRPGMRAEFSIVIATRAGVVNVPRSALQGEPSNRFIYVKDFSVPNAFVKTPVVVGKTNDRFVEIVSGLLPADEVVTNGAYSLAFAGSGSVSLKEALDAAHGHAHAEDGSELTGKDKAGGAKSDAHDDHGHDEGRQSPFWMIVSGVLFVLLLVVASWKRAGRKSDSAPAPDQPAA
jgi:multidrug efflux pump subunit AcrA (membrane-fusion protein)